MNTKLTLNHPLNTHQNFLYGSIRSRRLRFDIFLEQTNFSDPKLFLGPELVWTQHFFGPIIFWTLSFWQKNFPDRNFFSDPDFVRPIISLDSKLVWAQIFFWPKTLFSKFVGLKLFSDAGHFKPIFFGTSMRRSSGRSSGGRLLAMT